MASLVLVRTQFVDAVLKTHSVVSSRRFFYLSTY